MNNQPQSLDNLLQSAEQLLPQSGLDDAQQERIRKDARRLAADLKALLPEPGAVMTMTFVADQGFESFQYAWGGHAGLDGSKPLGLLEHVGGDPLLGFVARQKVDPKGYDLLVQWLKTAHGYFRDFGLPLMDEDDRAKIESFAEAAMPWFERLDKANREMLFPALADGQMALVVDARLTSKQYLAALPATEKPLPMLEPALILGLSDAKLFEKALGEYREIVNGLIEAMRQVEGVEIPEFFKIPEPETTEAAGGKIFGFPLPVEWGVDPQIVPNLALSDKVCVLSASRAHSERLMKATPPALGGVLARTDRPLALAAWFRWSSLLEAAAPWIDFAVDQVLAEQGDDTEAKAIVDQVRAVVSVLGTLRTVTDEGYIEDGALVHHSLVEIRDVEK